MIDIRKLNSLHYRLLRIATRDWKNRTPRCILDKVGRARPTTWAKYSSASTAIKILRDKCPVRLHQHLTNTLYYERRASNVVKFYDNSKKRVGRQAFGNRLKTVFEEINKPIFLNESNNAIRLLLKKSFFIQTDSCNLPVAYNGPGLESPDSIGIPTNNPALALAPELRNGHLEKQFYSFDN
jgi:hypothetical protein